MSDRASWAVGRYATRGGEYPNVWAGLPRSYRVGFLVFGVLVAVPWCWVDDRTRRLRRAWKAR